MKENKLDKYTFKEIHQVVRDSIDKIDAETKLAATDFFFKRYLNNIIYKHKPLNYTRLKEISPAELQAEFGNNYLQPIIAPRGIRPNTKTIREIHIAIINSTSPFDAAMTLGMQQHTLERHLGKFKYQNRNLTYRVMKRIKQDGAQLYWGEAYDQPMQGKNIKLTQRPIREIHEVISGSSTPIEAANSLGVDFITLKRFFKKIALGFEQFKKFSPAKVKRIVGALAYEIDFNTAAENNSSIAETSGDDQADNLEEIEDYLAQNSTDDLPDEPEPQADDASDNSQTQNDEATSDSDNDTTPLIPRDEDAIKKKLTQYTMQEMRHIIRKSGSLAAAARHLRVGKTTLETHLAKFHYQQEILTYSIMKRLTAAGARAFWGDKYTEPMSITKVKLNEINLARIHEQILQSTSPKNAAIRLGVDVSTLMSYLTKSNLEYKTLKKLSQEQAATLLPNYNWQPPIRKSVVGPKKRYRKKPIPAIALLPDEKIITATALKRKKSSEDLDENCNSKRVHVEVYSVSNNPNALFGKYIIAKPACLTLGSASSILGLRKK